MPQQFPKRIERGPLAGQEFGSRAEYRKALAHERGALTEYQARSLAARERGFEHYSAERRAKEQAAERGEVAGTLPNGHEWKVVGYRTGRKQWHKVHDKAGRQTGKAPRTQDLPKVTAVVVETPSGRHAILLDGLEDWDAWYDAIDDVDSEYG